MKEFFLAMLMMMVILIYVDGIELLEDIHMDLLRQNAILEAIANE